LTFLLGSIVVTFHLNPIQAGSLAAMTFAGQRIGKVAAGLTADRFGRRLVFQVTTIVWGLASFAAAEVRRRTGRELPTTALFKSETHEHPNPLATIFSRADIRRTIMAFSVWFFALLGFFGLNSWIAVLLKSHGFSIIGSVGFVTLITLGGIPGFYLTGVLLERIGRKPVTAAVLVFGAAAAFVYGSATTITILFVTGFVMQFFMFGIWSALYAYTPELYSTRARATGAGLASAFGRVGAIIGPIVLPVVVANAGTGAAFDLGAAAFCIAAVWVLTLGVETKGRVLELVSA